MAFWRQAKSLSKLRDQVNAAFSNRDKSSDGSIGDTTHAARKSDHNPNAAGVVTAYDIDEDLVVGATTVQGVSASMIQLVAAICASKDPRVKYIIYEGKMTVKGSQMQAWQRYTGPNAHKHHCHISVAADPALYDDARDWSITPSHVATPSTDLLPSQHYIVAAGDTLWGIAHKFTTDVVKLKQLNGLTTDTIKVGQGLRVA